MSVKKDENYFLDKFKAIYNHGIEIKEYIGFTKPITYICDICGKTHHCSDARQLLEKRSYCMDLDKSNKKMDQEEFLRRIEKMHQEKIEIIEYHGLSGILKYKCPQCGNIKSISTGRALITKLSLCDDCYGVEKQVVKRKIDALFNATDAYDLLVWRGPEKKLTERCNTCGFIYDRYPTNVIQCFNSCPNCNNGKKKLLLESSEAQKRIDKEFGENQYELLTYTGQLDHNNRIRCLNCNLIFTTHFTSFLSSRGCPKCQRFQSKGEKMVKRYLENNNISFTEQRRFPDCNNSLSSFDFCVYDVNHNMYLIEVNGVQHYKPTTRFEDLKIIQRRDQVKIDYCKEKNIPLIIIPYNDLTEEKIEEYLSFLKGSTTIP